MFQSLVNFGDGRVIGRNLARFWGNDPPGEGFNIQPQYQLDGRFSDEARGWRHWGAMSGSLPARADVRILSIEHSRVWRYVEKTLAHSQPEG
jgi:hypothetical protein